jgi:predicted PurR-regulated permease PerM
LNGALQPQIVPKWSARQVVLATLFVTAVTVVFWLLYRYRSILLLLFIAIVLGTAIRPVVDWLMRRGLPRTYALAIVYIGLFTAIVAFLLLLVPTLTQQSLELSVRLPEIYSQLRAFLLDANSRFIHNIAIRLPTRIDLLMNASGESTDPFESVNRLFSTTGLIVKGLFSLIAMLLLAFFWVLESDRLSRSAYLLVPAQQRSSVQEIAAGIENKVGAFVRGQLILCLFIGGMAYIAYLIIGLPNAFALAVVAGVFEAVPVFGPALGAIPAFFVALTLDPIKAVGVVIALVVIQTAENYILVPRIMGKSLGVNPIVTLLSLAAFSSLFGLIGALLALPIAAIIQLFIDRFLLTPDAPEANPPPGRDYYSVLQMEAQALIQDVRKQVRVKDAPASNGVDEIEDEIEAIVIELDALLQQRGTNGEVNQ